MDAAVVRGDAPAWRSLNFRVESSLASVTQGTHPITEPYAIRRACERPVQFDWGVYQSQSASRSGVTGRRGREGGAAMCNRPSITSAATLRSLRLRVRA